ncbi:MAG: 1,2-phenylacetyl-CoA epoxidase subunit B [Flavobacteriaceae bacterium]|nr:1,2-phenylacetyl-CoA epoxidase subunit B [Flavobacteriaceae bacterium]
MSKTDNQGPLWEVFTQKKPGLAFKHSGSVHAYDKNLAIEAARDLYTRRNEGTGLWVVKSENIIAVQSEDAESFFDPADDKIYRHPTFFEVPDGVKHM